MKIYIFDIEDWERQAFEGLQKEHDLHFSRGSLTQENANEYKDAEIVSIFIYSSVNENVLDALPDLQMIASRSTGVDHIATDTCKSRNITVTNVPSYGKNTVAEHAFGLLLTLSHRLEEAIERTREGQFSPRGLQGFDLLGKTFGVIGTGDIGRSAIKIANGFSMDVIAFDVKKDEQASKDLGFRYVDMEELLERSDIITFHVPSNPKTHHMISDEQFNKMKDGVVLINTSRGDIVDVRALARALANKKVSAAGLDVLAKEPVMRDPSAILRSVDKGKQDLAALLADEALIRMKNVVVTPHSAFNTKEAVSRILKTTIDNIQGFVHEKPQNAVGL